MMHVGLRDYDDVLLFITLVFLPCVKGDETSNELLNDNVRLVDNALSVGGTGGSASAANARKRSRVAGGNIFNPGMAKRKAKGAKIKK